MTGRPLQPGWGASAPLDWDYCLGDKRVKGTLNHHDGAYVGMSEIIGTPVLAGERLCVALGRDTRARARARGPALRLGQIPVALGHEADYGSRAIKRQGLRVL